MLEVFLKKKMAPEDDLETWRKHAEFQQFLGSLTPTWVHSYSQSNKQLFLASL